MKRPEYTKKTKSDKIEVNRYKMYRINDPLQFAYLFYPAKNATHRRAAFLAIFFAIKNAPKQRIESLDHLPEKYGLSTSTLLKARTKMVRIGLIQKNSYWWMFSGVFKNTLERLLALTDQFKAPVERPIQMKGEDMYIEMAKGELRKENQETGDDFTFGSDSSWISEKTDDDN